MKKSAEKNNNMNYIIALFCIIIIVIIVAVSTNVADNKQDITGNAVYDTVYRTPGMVKEYTVTEPYAYAYLRDK